MAGLTERHKGMLMKSYFKYWGKAKKDPEHEDDDYHLLVFHCLDVVAVADIWLQRSAILLNQMAAQLDKQQEETKSIILFFIALHDLGKFDARFQEFVPKLRTLLQGDEYEVEPEAYSHGSYGYQHFIREFGESEAMKDVAGHHGYCDLSIRYFEPDADEELIELDKQARKEWIDFCLDWLGLKEIPQVDNLTMLAGLCSVSDWVGSSITNFTVDPTQDLMNYYAEALPRAELALNETGMLATLRGAGFHYLFPGYQPRGIQTLLGQLPLKPGLTIVESDTGSGKTEFALSYASSLIHAGLADGIVFGLPTQATANGLFERIGSAAGKLFPDCSVTLAHGKAKYLVPDEDGFLHQSSKRAFLGSMSVATVDQVLMGVLGIKHQFIRSFGTRKSVLILDEIHSFDAYMYGLIEQVLKGQHQAYSSVILLSATLPKKLKMKLLKTYKGEVVSDEYPLISHSDGKGNTKIFTVNEQPVQKCINTPLWVSDNQLPTSEQCRQLIDWAENGAMVGVICNTVGDAQLLYTQLSEQTSMKIDLFHARYTFADRDRIEKTTLEKYGKNALRPGGLLVATQVIEQSLDLDFDVLVSQIAPVEFLMQRMGRLWRHDRTRVTDGLALRTDTIQEPTFITLAPSLAEVEANLKTAYAGSGYVYQNIRVLYRTQTYLQSRTQLCFPECYREAINLVHFPDPLPDESNELMNLVEQFNDNQDGALYTARMLSNQDSKPLSDVDPRCALLTRDGEMSVSVVLFNQAGELLHGGDYGEQRDRERNTVSLSRKLAKGIKDEEYHCLKAIVNKDISYSELGVFELVV